jgi:hypothetical protein
MNTQMNTVDKILDLKTGELMAGEFDNHTEAHRHAAYLNNLYGNRYAVQTVIAPTFAG